MMSDVKHRNVNGENHDQPGRVAQLIEVSVFLALHLIVPFVSFSFFPVLRGRPGFARVADATILSDLALVGLILFFLRRNGESVERIGWTFKNGWKDVVIHFLQDFVDIVLLPALGMG